MVNQSYLFTMILIKQLCLHLKAGSIPSVQPEQLQEPGDPQLQEWEHRGQQ